VFFLLLLLLLPAPAAAAPVDIGGLTQPVSVTVLPSGRVFIAEKPGVIKTAPSLDASSASVAVDISSTVGSSEDHGLTSVAYSEGYLYATYTVDQGYNDDCPDFGNGCPMPGRVSRWPVAPDGSLGAEDIVLDGAVAPGDVCIQATTHGVGNVEIAPNGKLIVSTGDGANFVDADIGQHTSTYNGQQVTDPCGYGGALRSQTDASPMGKILEVDPETGAYTALAKGVRNPFRTTILDGDVYATDTGWYKFEEINRIQLGGENFGWPCYEGRVRQEAYDGADVQQCEDLYAADNATAPFFHYAHPPTPNQFGNYASISAIAGHEGQIYYGDYTQNFIAKLSPDGQTSTVVSQGGIYPVDLYETPDGRLLYVDIGLGAVREVTAGDGEDPPPPNPYIDLTVTGPNPWSDGDTLSFAADTNLDDARQPPSWDWSVTLLSDCESSGRLCQRRAIPFTLDADEDSGTVTTPPTTGPSWVRVEARVTNASGSTSVIDGAMAENVAGSAAPEPLSFGVAGEIQDVNYLRNTFKVDGVKYSFDASDYLKISGVGVPMSDWKSAISVGDEIFGEVRIDPAANSELDLTDAQGDSNGIIDGYITSFDPLANELVLNGGRLVRYDTDDFFKVMGSGESLANWERQLSVCDRVRGSYLLGRSSELDIRSSGVDSTAPVSIDGLVDSVQVNQRRMTVDGRDLLYDTNDYLKIGDTGEWIVTWEQALEAGDNIRGCYFPNPSGVSELSNTGLSGPPSAETPIDATIEHVDTEHDLFVADGTRFTYDSNDFFSIDGGGDSMQKWELELLAGRRITGTFRPAGSSEFDVHRPGDGGQPTASGVQSTDGEQVKVRVFAPEEDMIVAATGKVAALGSRFSLLGSRRQLGAGERRVVKLEFRGKRARKAVKRAQRSDRKARATVQVNFTDPDGKQTKRVLRFPLR
jgi:glucose/arabinose dehydrogenase